MNAARWQRIEELFRDVIDLPADERESHLAQACADDEALRLEDLSLLARDTTEDFLQEPIARAAHALASVAARPGDDLTGERIGPYRITRLIGRGGMGAVYAAERDDRQFQQQVAIKVIRRGLDTDFARDRFLRERQILASLDHPYIARLFDGGALSDGLPYFVMEFVAGEPITDYCRRQRLSVNERLKLFRKVCSAVQHAHGRLVIHRDLKPSNILVTQDGTPKLLDFGIAKLLAPDPNLAHTRTETGVLLLTPEYASPEQLRGAAVATTTDVYSLGVVLYELLTERRPLEFRNHSPAGIERTFNDHAVEAPGRIASRVSGPLTRLSHALAGDLDNIVLTALRQEPERRYQSVEQFSEDIRRYLAGLPVVARKDTFGYRSGKFVRRHKAGVTILALLLLSVMAMTMQAARLARERDRANQEAAADPRRRARTLVRLARTRISTGKSNALLCRDQLSEQQGRGSVPGGIAAAAWDGQSRSPDPVSLLRQAPTCGSSLIRKFHSKRMRARWKCWPHSLRMSRVWRISSATIRRSSVVNASTAKNS